MAYSVMTNEGLSCGQNTENDDSATTNLEIEAVFRMTLYPTNGWINLCTFTKLGRLHLIA